MLTSNRHKALLRKTKYNIKEGRDVSGLGACEGLVVRENMYMTSRFRSLWRTETKKKQRVDLILGVPILISLGGQASPSARSAQIRGAVRVHQESLIRLACSSYG